MSIEPHHSSQMESRWRKPNLYVTVVGIYLLVLASLAIALAAYGIYLGLRGPVEVTVFIIMPFFLAIPSTIGGSLLLIRINYAKYISLIALILWTSILAYLTIGWAMFPSAKSLFYPSMIYVAMIFVLTSVMYPLFIIGWKRVQWR